MFLDERLQEILARPLPEGPMSSEDSLIYRDLEHRCTVYRKMLRTFSRVLQAFLWMNGLFLVYFILGIALGSAVDYDQLLSVGLAIFSAMSLFTALGSVDLMLQVDDLIQETGHAIVNLGDLSDRAHQHLLRLLELRRAVFFSFFP